MLCQVSQLNCKILPCCGQEQEQLVNTAPTQLPKLCLHKFFLPRVLQTIGHCSEPHFKLNLLAYATALIGPLVFQQLELNVSCVPVLVNAKCIALPKPGAYTLSFFKIRGGSCSSVWVALDSQFPIIKRWILQTALHSNNSPAHSGQTVHVHHIFQAFLSDTGVPDAG